MTKKKYEEEYEKLSNSIPYWEASYEEMLQLDKLYIDGLISEIIHYKVQSKYYEDKANELARIMYGG